MHTLFKGKQKKICDLAIDSIEESTLLKKALDSEIRKYQHLIEEIESDAIKEYREKIRNYRSLTLKLNKNQLEKLPDIKEDEARDIRHAIGNYYAIEREKKDPVLLKKCDKMMNYFDDLVDKLMQ